MEQGIPPSRALVIVFRVDASIEIGTGHVMRCLTLADALKQDGAECHFICRDHKGNLNDLIHERGFPVYSLPTEKTSISDPIEYKVSHEHWLQTCWTIDAVQTCVAIQEHHLHADWLIVDHYALDARWQKVMRRTYSRLMVIDDLADRDHIANLLLDQNLGRTDADYESRVPKDCVNLIGPQYALLRPEFSQLRQYSLDRREVLKLKHILLTMGGIDKDNVTGTVLQVLKDIDLPSDTRISVVMGSSAPWLEDVRKQSNLLKIPVDVRVNVNNMAELMANTDLVIGAAGSTSWERCCLGVPTVMFSLADNQRFIAQALERYGAVIWIRWSEAEAALERILNCLLAQPSLLRDYIRSASEVTDGKGSMRVAQHLTRQNSLC